jgi:aquaporin Z
MRMMPIRVTTGRSGWVQLKASFKKNWIHYLQEALGLGIFMISACYFSVLLWAGQGAWHDVFPTDFSRFLMMGPLMGATALLIFYSPFTSPSGSHINPAVTITFFRLGKMCRWDALFYILFQFAGGVLGVYIMRQLLGHSLTSAPVRSAITIPGDGAVTKALFMEFCIAFITMTMVLFTSHHSTLKKYTRLFSGILVCAWVIIAGPVSGFGMNPARSFASSVSANDWTASWLYLLAPIVAMLLAAEVFLFIYHPKAEPRGIFSRQQ